MNRLNVCVAILGIAARDRERDLERQRRAVSSDTNATRNANVTSTAPEKLSALRAKAAPLLQRIVDRSAEVHRLSPRETQVLHLLLEGDEYIQIAASLGIALRTVNVYTHSIFTKFGVHRREALFTTMFWRK